MGQIIEINGSIKTLTESIIIQTQQLSLLMGLGFNTALTITTYLLIKMVTVFVIKLVQHAVRPTVSEINIESIVKINLLTKIMMVFVIV